MYELSYRKLKKLDQNISSQWYRKDSQPYDVHEQIQSPHTTLTNVPQPVHVPTRIFQSNSRNKPFGVSIFTKVLDTMNLFLGVV